MARKLKTSVVAFDLAQFFPSINHDVLLSILDKQGFAPEVVVFFRSYLVDRFTCYAWDDDLSPKFPSSIGVGQGSDLSPILSALCLAPLLKEFERRVRMAVLISYVDNGTIIVQSDTWDKNLGHPFLTSYSHVHSHLGKSSTPSTTPTSPQTNPI
jgi:retron-type reverse transcriptase